MSYETLIFEKKDKIAYIIFNRPKVYNAINDQMILELMEVLELIEKDGEIRALILTGSEKTFISGGDIHDLEEATRNVYKFYLWHDKMMKLLLRFERLPILVIAAVNGYALGGGFEMITGCDIRVASEGAKLGAPEVKRGIMPGAGGAARLPRLIGAGRALEMLLSGEPIDAMEAYRIGLVNKVAPKGEAVRVAEELAKKIIENAPLAITQIKNSVHIGMAMNVEGASEYCQKNAMILLASEDAKEGMKSFLEKRAPVWQGK